VSFEILRRTTNIFSEELNDKAIKYPNT